MSFSASYQLDEFVSTRFRLISQLKLRQKAVRVQKYFTPCYRLCLRQVIRLLYCLSLSPAPALWLDYVYDKLYRLRHLVADFRLGGNWQLATVMLISGSKLYLNRLTTPTTRLPHPLFLPFFCSLELALHSTGILGCARDKVTENVSRSWRWRWRRSRRRRRSRHCCRRCCKCLKVNFEFKIHHVTQYVDLLNTNAKSSDSTNASLYSKWGEHWGGGWMWNVEANAKWQHKLKYTHPSHTLPHLPQQIQQTQREFWRQTNALLSKQLFEVILLCMWAEILHI